MQSKFNCNRTSSSLYKSDPFLQRQSAPKFGCTTHVQYAQPIMQPMSHRHHVPIISDKLNSIWHKITSQFKNQHGYCIPLSALQLTSIQQQKINLQIPLSSTEAGIINFRIYNYIKAIQNGQQIREINIQNSTGGLLSGDYIVCTHHQAMAGPVVAGKSLKTVNIQDCISRSHNRYLELDRGDDAARMFLIGVCAILLLPALPAILFAGIIVLPIAAIAILLSEM